MKPHIKKFETGACDWLTTGACEAQKNSRTTLFWQQES